MTFPLLITLFLLSVPLALAQSSLTLLLPLSYQYPPVARVGHPYSWTFSATTFNTSQPLSYIAIGLPSWLSFASSTRTFSGSPTSENVGTYPVQITATTSDGQSSLSDHVVLAVSERTGQLNITAPIVDQLTSSDSAITSAFPFPSQTNNSSPLYPGVRVPPSWSFSLGFQSYTFTAPSKVYFSAAQADGSPLPEWLDFNNYTVTFDGVTPQVETGTMFNIVLSGSDVYGYSDAQQEFAIVIAAHDLQVASTPTLNLTMGSEISIDMNDVLQQYALIDDKPIHNDDIANMTINTSSLPWLSFDTADHTLSASVPPSQSTASLAISVTDKYGDSLQTDLQLVFYPSAFRSAQLTPTIAQLGTTLSLPLNQFLASGVNGSNTNISATFDPRAASSWLCLSTNNLTLTGVPPVNAGYDSVTITLHAEDLITHAVSTTSMLLSLLSNGTADASTHPHPQDQGSAHPLGRGAAIAIGLIAALVLAGILLFALAHVRRRKAGAIRRRADKERAMDSEEKWGYEAAETPALEYVEKMGDPATAHMLVGLPVVPITGSMGASSETTVVESVLRIPWGKSRVRPSGPASGGGGGGDGDGSGASFRSRIGSDDSTGSATQSAVTMVTANSKGHTPRSFLSNPFGKKPAKVIPKISNPIIMPSLSNAAFQAQLAAAVDQAGIVRRHSTYAATTNSAVSGSEFDRSDITYLENDHEERSDGGFTATGTGSEVRSRTPSYISGSEVDRSLAGSKASYRTDLTGDTEMEVRTTITDDSQFAGSSRASWESEPPFAWNVDAPRPLGEREESSGAGGPRSATPSDLSHEAASASASASTSASTSASASASGSKRDPDAPVQRADFRSHPPSTGYTKATQRAVTPPRSQTIEGTTATLSDLSYEGISIDNIHFPTDSDIAHTEASFPSDRDEAVIRTASRIDARRTLDSPATASLASSHTERGGVPSPVMTTHSRLVSFGKQKKVEVEGGGGRSVSQSAVLGTISTAGTTGTTVSSGGVGLGIAVGPGAGAGSVSKAQGGRTTPPVPSPPKAMTRPRAPVPSRSPSPPSSLPSLPALPTLPSTSSAASRAGKSRGGYSARPPPLAEPQRILLGVSEPFHFYPPMSISPSSSGSTASHSSSRAGGAEYVALVERRSGSVGVEAGAGAGGMKGRTASAGEEVKLGELPSWLHFEDGELWGVPAEEDRGEVDVRIVERRGEEDRVVGRFALEVVGR